MSTARPYRSSRRQHQAAETRLAIRSAARDLFGTSGFAGVTISAIAREAGVAPATVYATYGSKAAIVVAILDQLEADSGMREQGPAMLAEPDPRTQLTMFASAHVALLSSAVDVLRAAMEARGEPEVRALLERGDGHRRSGIEALVGQWVRSGVVDEAARDETVERMWLLSSVESYLLAADRLGWSPTRIEEFLRGLLVREVLGPPAPAGA